MSATLAVMLRQMQPDWTIQLIERLDGAAAESSDAWNNAGTGHAAFCELNYTPETPDGGVVIDKAIAICESFDESRQFWSFLVEQNMVSDPGSFIRQTPHLAFVWGQENVDFLRKRYDAMRQIPLFGSMEYSEDAAKLSEWMPLVMEGRDPAQKVAATRMQIGTDVNFGALTRAMIEHLRAQDGVTLAFSQSVIGLRRQSDGRWQVTIKDRAHATVRQVSARFVFIGAGGWSLPLLIKSGIPESQGYGGFPGVGAVAQVRQPRSYRPPRGQGLRQSRRRRAADVRAAPRYPRHRRRKSALIWALRRVLDQVFEAGFVFGFAALDSTRQYVPDALGRAR